jgi:glycosyltransferase involved in cell wall biosynthesis
MTQDGNTIGQQQTAAVISVLPPGNKGGYERFLLDLIEALENEGYQVDTYAVRSEPAGDRTTLRKWFSDLTLLIKILLYGVYLSLVGNKYDVVISSDFVGWSVWPINAKRVHMYSGMALTDQIGDENTLRNSVLRILYRWSGKGKLVIVKSQRVSSALQEVYGLESIVLPNPLDTEKFRPIQSPSTPEQQELPEEAPIGLFVGRWDDNVKGTDTLRDLIDANSGIHWLLVIGGGKSPHGLESVDNYTVVRDVLHDQMATMYSVADFTVIPSRSEGFCYVAIESLACETLVITCPDRIPSLDPIYDRAAFDSVSVSSPEDIDEYVEAIQRLIDNPNKADELGQQGRELVQEHYSHEVWLKKLVEILE